MDREIICLTVTNNNILIFSFLVIVLIFQTPGATNYMGENGLYPSYRTASASSEGGNGAKLAKDRKSVV